MRKQQLPTAEELAAALAKKQGELGNLMRQRVIQDHREWSWAIACSLHEISRLKLDLARLEKRKAATVAEKASKAAAEAAASMLGGVWAGKTVKQIAEIEGISLNKVRANKRAGKYKGESDGAGAVQSE
jgi:hypothetical protein